jgi:hypothetical protein
MRCGRAVTYQMVIPPLACSYPIADHDLALQCFFNSSFALASSSDLDVLSSSHANIHRAMARTNEVKGSATE